MSMMYIRNLVDLHLKYYTDAHDVDEDLRTISFHGGMFIGMLGMRAQRQE